MQRRSYAVALYTGRRKQDPITRARAHRKDGGICAVPSKTGDDLWIPEHRELTAELARGVAGTDCILHGLRKTAVAKYVKGANQNRRAKRAMAAWENDR